MSSKADTSTADRPPAATSSATAPAAAPGASPASGGPASGSAATPTSSTIAPASSSSGITSGLHLTFDDEFNSFSSSPDGSSGTWTTTYPFGGETARTLPANHEAEFYSDNSVGENPFSVNNGVLTISATPAAPGSNPYGLPYDSGVVSTHDSFAQQYGYFEMRAQLPAGAGLWPAFWMIPKNDSFSSELDVLEQLGNDPKTIYATAHDWAGGDAQTGQKVLSVPDASAGFHTYGVDWEPDTTTFYEDGKPTGSVTTPASMRTPMIMMANLAVGGAGSWPGAPDGSTQFPAQMQVDYIRAYATANTVNVSGRAALANGGTAPSPAPASTSLPSATTPATPSNEATMSSATPTSVAPAPTTPAATLPATGANPSDSTGTPGTGGSTAPTPASTALPATLVQASSPAPATTGTGTAPGDSTGGSASGVATAPPTVGTGSDTVVLTLSEDAYAGDAQFTFSVDGKVVGPAQSVTAPHSPGQSETFTFKGDWAAGAHQFGVTFTNDKWDGSPATDRNLYVDGATYDGGQVEGATALMTNGTVTFGATAAPAPSGQPTATGQPAAAGSGAGPGPGVTPPVVGTGADTLVLTMSETAYQGDAQFTVTVDGKAAGPAQSVTAAHGQGQPESFTYKGNWGTGAHTVGIAFSNPATEAAGQARQLYLDSASLDGIQAQGATMVSAGKPVNFSLTPPAQGTGSAAPAGTMTVTDNGGGTGTVTLIGSGSHTDHPSGTSTVTQTVSNGTDTIEVAGTAKGEALSLGAGQQKIVLVNPRAMVLTGGSGTDTVSADTGANTYVAGTGSLTVTGGSDASGYVLHAGSGQMSVDDFNFGKGDTLTVDKSLQGALKQAGDGHGGTLLTFGAGQGSIDLIHHASVNQSDLRFI